jgi:DNA processing protein
MDVDELSAWLRLLETPKVGRESARKLLSSFGSPDAVLRASAAARCEVVSSSIAQALAAKPDTLDALVRATTTWLANSTADSPRAIIALGDPRYPAQLLNSADPPLLLYTQGQTEWLSAPSVAVVGSRNPTPQGIDNARQFAQHLSQAGLTVVSGLALGIDGAAHAGALPHPGRTIAVVGTGLDRVYPRGHRDLAHRIAQLGLIMSEYPIGSAPLPHHFPQRNRIIAGLAQGLLVVEATLQSGSLISARLALESSREVFAIPGSIHAPQSRGCHALLKQGAKLVESGQDILEELRWHQSAPVPRSPDDPEESTDPVLLALGYDPVSLDALLARTGSSASAINTRLLELELQGHVARLPGQLFQRMALA